MAHDVRNPHILQNGPGNTADAEAVMDNYDALWAARDVLAPKGHISGGGKSIIATTGTRTNTAYGALSDAPDQVSGIVLPADSLLFVAYQALWQESIDGTAEAAIFLGANQLRTQIPGTAGPVIQSAICLGNAGIMSPLATGPTGMQGRVGVVNVASTSDVTTGQAITYDSGQVGSGGPCCIFAGAGAYTVSVQFKATSGTVSAKERKLWVWVQDFS